MHMRNASYAYPSVSVFAAQHSATSSLDQLMVTGGSNNWRECNDYSNRTRN
jgi:hypothetical protein